MGKTFLYKWVSIWNTISDAFFILYRTYEILHLKNNKLKGHIHVVSQRCMTWAHICVYIGGCDTNYSLVVPE